jgi:fumarate reductase (CoM/CoB) subunit A
MCDVLVVGAGGAGCRAAIEASKHNLDVIMLSKELLGKAHTAMAEGGYNVSLGNVDPDDDPETHFKDTIVGGNYLNNQNLAEILVRDAPQRVFDLRVRLLRECSENRAGVELHMLLTEQVLR